MDDQSSFTPEEGKFYSPEELGLPKQATSSASMNSFKPEKGKFYSAEDLGISKPQQPSGPKMTPEEQEYEKRIQKYMPEAKKVLSPVGYSLPGANQAYAAAAAGLGFGEGENFSERYQNQRAKQDAYRRAKEEDTEQRIQEQMPKARTAYENLSPMDQKANAFLSGFVNLPVIGPVAQKVASAGTAAFQGPEEGKTFDERYLNNLAKIQANNRLSADKNKVANLMGSFAQAPFLPGGAATTLPELMTVGAGIGAAQAIGEGENPLTEAAIGGAGGAFGYGLGRLLSPKEGSKLAKAGDFTKGVISPETQGQKSGIQTFGQRYLDELARVPRDANGNITDPRFLTPEIASEQQKLGQEIMGTDIGGGALAREARVQAIQHPEFESQLKGELLERQAQQKEDVEDMFENLYGQKMNPIELIEQSRETAQKVNGPNYKAVFSDPKAQDVWNPRLQQLIQNPEIVDLMQEAKKDLGWYRIKDTDKGPLPNPLLKSKPMVTVGDKEGISELEQMENKLREQYGLAPNKKTTEHSIVEGPIEPEIPLTLEFWDAMKRAAQSRARVPGAPKRYGEMGQEIKDALGSKYLGDLGKRYTDTVDQAKHFFDQDNAFEAGQHLTRNLSSIKRAELDRRISKMTPDELSQVEKGMVSEMLYKISNSTNPNSATKMLDSPNVRSTFKSLTTPERANQIETLLRVENIKNANRNAVLNQSKTAQNHQDMARKFVHSPIGIAILGGGSLEGLDWLSGHITPFNYAEKAALAGAAAFITHRYNQFGKAQAHAIQNLLLSKNPEEWQKAIDAVSSSPKSMNMLRNIDRGMAKSTAPVYQFLKNYASPTYEQQDQNREGRKEGGRLSKKIKLQPGEIDLFARVMQSRKDHKKDTKPTLDKHDNEIASSLQQTQQQVTHADPIHS